MNDFLIDLLAFQQDGAYAISAPANWTQDPLLDVPTETDDVIRELGSLLLRGSSGNSVARWHFFIGSPGNGKSAAMGKLCRSLLREQACRILDEHDVPIDALRPSAVPYALRVFEGENSFPSAMVVQDASVVRNPFAEDVDPATELVSTLEEAWDKGISLVVCTNRGVIEKAYWERYHDPAFSAKPCFRILGELIQNGEQTLRGHLSGSWDLGPRKKLVFSKVRVAYTYLDNCSLLLGSHVFDDLVAKAISDHLWAACCFCETSPLCPFKGNRDWLADQSARAGFLRVLRRAEVLSGQIIVFREALAFLSLLLAGCPRDYGHDHHPCEWVRGRAQVGDLMALGMRRIYMSVFSSFSPYGLEASSSLSRKQAKGLDILGALIKNDGRRIADARALAHVLNSTSPSTDVGVGRLTGRLGVFAEIDPWLEGLPASFLDEWDGDLAIVATHGHPLCTELDRQCALIWASLEELLESTPSHDAPLCHWALRRWSSNFLLHLGGLLEGRTSWAKELDEFVAILETVARDPSARTTEEKRRIVELDRQLEKLLTAGRGGRDVVPLSLSVVLSGPWVAQYLRPRIDTTRQLSGVTVTIKFQGGESAQLGARAFVWLRRHLEGKLEVQCFPRQLLIGVVDARIRAAARGPSAYAFSDDDVELRVLLEDGGSFTLTRLDGDVHVQHER